MSVFSFFRPKKVAQKSDDQSGSLNGALQAYVATFPSRSRLSSHLESTGLSSRTEEIKAALDAALSTTDSYLYAQEKGVSWSPEFEVQMRTHLVSRHPWLNQESVSRLLGYSKWLCWHEGLNATVGT